MVQLTERMLQLQERMFGLLGFEMGRLMPTDSARLNVLHAVISDIWLYSGPAQMKQMILNETHAGLALAMTQLMYMYSDCDGNSKRGRSASTAGGYECISSNFVHYS